VGFGINFFLKARTAKLEKADQLKIAIISEEDFLGMIGNEILNRNL